MGAYMGLYEISFCCVVSGTQIDAIMKTEDRDLFSKVPETLARDVVTTNVSMVTLPETNIAPARQPSQKVTSLPISHF